MTYKITTWNVNSLKVRQGHVLEFLAEHKPSVMCLQELKMPDYDIDKSAFEAVGYSIVSFGQKTYNGVATIIDKSIGFTTHDLVKNIPSYSDVQSRLLALTINTNGRQIRVVNGYFPNGESTDSEKFPYKLAWLDALSIWLKNELITYPNLIVLGDFNIAPADEDVKNPEEWVDSVICVKEVRDRFQRLIELGLVDSFRQHDQPPKTYSWWDYRMLAFRKNIGMRIDHILVSKSLAGFNKSVVINKDYRGKERPSDHAPVTLTLEL